MKPRQFYMNISKLLYELDSTKAKEFNVIIDSCSPREVYLWLDSKLTKSQISDELEKLMKDFFFSIH